MMTDTLSSPAAVISAPASTLSPAGEDASSPSGGGGALPTETLSILSVQPISGRLWNVEIYVPGTGRRNIVLTNDMVTRGYVPMAAQAVALLYGMV